MTRPQGQDPAVVGVDGTALAAREMSGALAPSVATSTMTAAPAPTMAPTLIIAPTTTATPVISDSATEESTSSLASSNAPTTTTTTTTATWWGYVGWGSSIPTTTSGSAEPLEKEETPEAEAAAADKPPRPLVGRMEGAREENVTGGLIARTSVEETEETQ